MRKLRFVTMASPLARSQTEAVVAQVAAHWPDISCSVDAQPSPIATGRDKDEVFVALSGTEISHLQDAVLAKEADVFVVGATDITLPLPAGLSVLCVVPRATPFDAYLNRQGLIMDEMDPGCRIGVMSMRARCQMAPLWPDLRFEILRGGVDRAMETHLRKSEIDGLVIPAAATENLGIQSIVAEMFAPDFILPSAGQGIMAVLGRTDDDDAIEILTPLHSLETAIEMTAERSFCDHMVRDQDLPVGALATVADDEVHMVGATGACTNRVVVTGRLDEAEAVGTGLAAQILSSGDSLADLLEAEFPDGLPEESTDPDDPDDPGARSDRDDRDEDADILSSTDFALDKDETAAEPMDFDDLEHMKAWEDLAGISDQPAKESDDVEEDDDYD